MWGNLIWLPKTHIVSTLNSYFEKTVVWKNVHATNPKGSMGYDQYIVHDTVAVEPTFVSFLKHSQT